MTLLPEDFQPGENDVICGRGKKCYNHIGNERFRVHVMSMLDEYSRAKSKLDKTGVLATVVAQIRAKSPNGGFVKQDEHDRWFEVGDFLAKEKTSQAFRDALHERYKSSNVAKKKRRQEEQTRTIDRFRGVTRSNSDGPGLEWLSLSNAATAGQDLFQSNNLDVVAQLQRMNELSLQATNNLKSQQPIRSQSALGITGGSGMLSGSLGVTNSNMLAGASMQNAAFPSVMSFSNVTIQQQQMTSSAQPSTMIYLPSTNVGSQEPLDAYQTISAQTDLEIFDLISPPQRNRQFISGNIMEQLHHSMPELSRPHWDPMEFQSNRVMHNSAPDLNYNGMNDDDSLGDVELDPLSLAEVTPRPPSPKKKINAEQFKKPLSMTLSPTSPSVAVSSDLLACLYKLNGSAITDSNPFEPLPLSEEGDDEDDPEAMDEEKVTVNRKMLPSAFDALHPPLSE